MRLANYVDGENANHAVWISVAEINGTQVVVDRTYLLDTITCNKFMNNFIAEIE